MTDATNEIQVDVPHATLGDFTTVKGSLLKASTEFVDWEALHNGQPDAISIPGLILLDLARRLPA